MSEYYDSVIVRIRNQEDLEDFADLIGKPTLKLPVTKKTQRRTVEFTVGDEAGVLDFGIDIGENV